MPKRTDLRKILIIGSGPIVIGQACEFDYSGTQAVKALREEGFEVVLVNSNPATIMTDPELAQRTYVEPLTPEFVAKIIERERPQALLPTLGGQTGLNLAVALAEDGTLERFGVELIGAKLPAIRKAEDRQLFKEAMERIGLALPRSGYARSLDEARAIVRQIGYPAIIRPSFTLGGTGGSIAYNPEELEEAIRWGLQTSPVSTPISRMIAIAASRMSWYSLSVRVCAGATVSESPVWTPIGSTFSIEQMMTTLSARSRITSSSNSFQPITDSSTSTVETGDVCSPQRTASSSSSGL